MVLFSANRPGEPGIILWEVAVAALCFEALYRSFGVAFRALSTRKGVALDPKRQSIFARDGNSYAVSFLHAFVVVWRGCQHLIQQWGAPLEAKFVQQPYGSSNAWAAGAALPPDFFDPEGETSRRRRAAPSPRPSDTRGHAGGRSDSADGALEDALGRFIKSNVALYERVLLMETVDVDEVLATVRRAPAPLAPGVAVAKVPRAKLLAYLEREGVAVTHTSGRRARATRTRF